MIVLEVPLEFMQPEVVIEPAVVLCNVKRINEQIIKCNRIKEDCNLLYIFSSFVLSCFCFCLHLNRRNIHDCLGVMQSLYYKSLSKPLLRSEGTGT